jgi:hypothetical protein
LIFSQHFDHLINVAGGPFACQRNIGREGSPNQ